MGKLTKEDKQKLQLSLDVQMNVRFDIEARNPEILALERMHHSGELPELDLHREKERILEEVCGEIFPFSGFPVMLKEERDRLDEFVRTESELLLSIDLNFTKSEIIFVVEQFVDRALEENRKECIVKHKRKPKTRPLLWQDYMEIWDLRNGYQPWKDLGDGIKLPTWKRTKSRWTYEQIGRHLYPHEQTPEDLNRATDRVKKQCRVAYKFICGKKYDPKERKEQAAQTMAMTRCSRCPEIEHCEEACPALEGELKSNELSQQHLLIRKAEQLDIDQYVKSSRKRSADEQFD